MFLTKLVNKLISEGIADPERIIFTGWSNGGMMSFKMACDSTLKIWGIAPVSANMPQPLDCGRTKSRLLNIVGTSDRLVPMAGGGFFGTTKRGIAQSADMSFRAFLDANDCHGVSITQLFDKADDGMKSEVLKGNNCGRKPVWQIVVEGGGHAWAGSSGPLEFIMGKPTMDFSASEKIVQFALDR